MFRRSLSTWLLFSLSGTSQQVQTLYDATKVPSYSLPDALVLRSGEKVRDAKTWTARRRPEILAIYGEEVFGPVVSVLRAKNYDEALHLANDTPFGLAAGIATTSLKYATHFKRHSQAGMVMVNLPTAGVDYHVPFGGRKGSSYGPREQGRYAAEFYTTVKTAYVAAG